MYSKIVLMLRVGDILQSRINLFVFAETAPFLHWKNHMQLFHQNLLIISLFHNNKRIIEHRATACNENTLTFLYKSTKWQSFFIYHMNCFIKWEMIMRSHFVNLIISYHRISSSYFLLIKKWERRRMKIYFHRTMKYQKESLLKCYELCDFRVSYIFVLSYHFFTSFSFLIFTSFLSGISYKDIYILVK